MTDNDKIPPLKGLDYFLDTAIKKYRKLHPEDRKFAFKCEIELDPVGFVRVINPSLRPSGLYRVEEDDDNLHTH